MLASSYLCPINRRPAVKIPKTVIPAQHRPRTVRLRRRHANCQPKKFNKRKKKKVIYHVAPFNGFRINPPESSRKRCVAQKLVSAVLTAPSTVCQVATVNFAAAMLWHLDVHFCLYLRKKRNYSWISCVQIYASRPFSANNYYEVNNKFHFWHKSIECA